MARHGKSSLGTLTPAHIETSRANKFIKRIEELQEYKAGKGYSYEEILADLEIGYDHYDDVLSDAKEKYAGVKDSDQY